MNERTVATDVASAVAATTIGPAEASGIRFCHFSVVQTRLKSRAFHMECMPLAANGMEIRYVSPAAVEDRDRIHFVRAARRGNPLLRLLPDLLLLRRLLMQRASVYHFQEPELLPLAFVLKLIFRKRVVYDAYEDFPSMMGQKTRIPRLLQPVAAAIVAAVERMAARTLDGIITADFLTLRRLARSGKSHKLVFYNFPNLKVFPAPLEAAKEFDIVYRGGLSERAGTYLLLQALALLACSGKRVTLLLIGYADGARGEEELRRRIRDLKLEGQIEIHPRIEHEEMAGALVRARLGVSPLQATPKFLLNIPVKVFEYWACGLPVVSSDLPPIRPFFRIARAGLLFHPGDSNDLARCISWMLDHPEMTRSMGKRGRDAVVERFNNEGESRKLRRFCEHIAAHH